ncbi:NAD(P)-dependent oxidoreductase [Paucilactobacillus sp. N302-9]
MKIGILGATGMTGQQFFKEATSRGHDVTAIVRNRQKAEDLLQTQQIIESDVFDLTFDQLKDFDVVVNALNVPRNKNLGYLHIDMAAHLIRILRNTTQPRILFVVGAASLQAPDGELFIDRFKKDPSAQSWIDTPQMQVHELHFLQTVTNVNWVAVSPALNYSDGPKTNYRRNDDDKAMFNQDGVSTLSSGNLAAAIVDELEKPTIHQARFAVGNDDYNQYIRS